MPGHSLNGIDTQKLARRLVVFTPTAAKSMRWSLAHGGIARLGTILIVIGRVA